MKDTCGCCEGTEPITPEPIANRPGLDALHYRVGTHATFLETMLARLSNHDYPALEGLGTRDADDPAIALLDAWATVADVLTFYQERIANEGYLRTATERRSVLELARLVGYSLRPGVSASVYLAYTLDNKMKEPVVIPRGARVQSIPGPGEMAQSFETSEDLTARWEWSALKPRLSQPQYILKPSITPDLVIYVNPVAPALKPNDPLLLQFGEATEPELFRVLEVTPPGAVATEGTVPNQQDISTAIQVQPWNTPAWSTPQLPDSVTVDDLFAYFTHRFFKTLVPGITFIGPVATQIGKGFELLKQLAEDESWSLDHAEKILPTLTLAMKRLRALCDTSVPHFSQQRNWIDALLQELDVVVQFLTFLVTLSQIKQPLESGDLNQACPLVAKAEQQLSALSRILVSYSGLRKLLAGDLGTRKSFLEGAANSCQREQPFSAPVGSSFARLVQSVSRPPAIPPPSPRRLVRPVSQVFALQSDMAPRLVVTMGRALDQVYAAWADSSVPPGKQAALEGLAVLRVQASLFGHNLPGLPIYQRQPSGLIEVTDYADVQLNNMWPDLNEESNSALQSIYLDREYDQIKLNSWVAIETPEVHSVATNTIIQRKVTIHRVKQVQTVTLSESGLATPVTQIMVDPPWLDLAVNEITELLASEPFLRGTRVYAQSEPIDLAEEPTPGCVEGNEIELVELYPDLQPGRWLIVSGERVDVDNTSGITASELVMLSNVIQDVRKVEEGTDLPSDKPHTFLRLALNGLAYKYKRDTVTIYGNVVKATHGETRAEILGSGDASQTLQSFTLKQPPLTYVAAPNPSGVESTLLVRVNEVQWHVAPGLAGLEPTDRCFILKTDDDAKTTVIFGDGQQGARLPTGTANIKATYRNGIGKMGNVKAGQISLLMTRPLGVKEVINPLPASGGADNESRDQARKNAPLAVMALDRLVSMQDYSDFARTYAGIGKASAVRLPVGRRELVHVTVAGADDIPIDKTSALYRNLVQALRQSGDPYQPVQIDPRELLLLIAEVRVRLLPDYAWELQEPKIRAALLEAFSFEQRELGQDVLYAEVIACIQAVPGVAYVDVDTLDAASEQDVLAFLAQDSEKDLIAFLKAQRKERGAPSEEQPRQRIVVHLARPDGRDDAAIAPAQLAFLSPAVPDTLILKEITQ
jgi:hypothetical protein